MVGDSTGFSNIIRLKRTRTYYVTSSKSSIETNVVSPSIMIIAILNFKDYFNAVLTKMCTK